MVVGMEAVMVVGTVMVMAIHRLQVLPIQHLPVPAPHVHRAHQLICLVRVSAPNAVSPCCRTLVAVAMPVWFREQNSVRIVAKHSPDSSFAYTPVAHRTVGIVVALVKG